MNIVDKVIGFFNPEAAWQRAMFREGLDQLRNYNAAKVDRLQPWVPVNASPEQTDGPHRDLVKARARDLERNSDMAEAAIGAITRNVVGTGIKPQAKVKKADGTTDEKINDRLEELWKIWVKAKNCDITGLSTFYELQDTMLRRRIVDGEIFCKMVTDRSSAIPLRLQGIESDLLDTSLIQAPKSKNPVISGVEVNEHFQPLAYWFVRATPDGFTSLDSQRVPASQVMHLFKKVRFNQVRGVSELARVIPRMKETGEYLDAELVAAKIAASFALFVKKNNPGNMGRQFETKDGKRIEHIAPGMIEYLMPGEDIATAAPSRGATTVRDFIEIETRLTGAGMGLSYEAISRDMSKTNYSSARQNHLEDRRTWQPMQEYLVQHFCQPVWESFVEACVLGGLIDLPDYWQDPEKYHKCYWIAPGWTWIDPLKDVKASREELAAGLNTLQEICAERGLDWQEVIEQRAREQEYMEELGLLGKGVDANAGKDKTT